MSNAESFRKRLATIHDARRRLDAIIEHISSVESFDPAESRDVISEAEQIAIKLRALEILGSIPLYEGIAHYRLGTSDAAQSSLRRAYDLLRDAHQNYEMGEAAIHLGDICRANHSYEDANQWYERALEAWDRDELRGHRTRALHALGEMCLEIGRWEKAFDCLTRALTFYENEHNGSAAAGCLISIGAVHTCTNDTGRALETLQLALACYKEAGDKYGEVTVLSRLAGICRQHGDLTTALHHSLTALAIYEALGDRANAGATLITIAAIHEDLGQTESALQFYLKAHDTLDGSETERLQARALHGIGRLYCQLGDVAGAQFLLENALLIARQINDRQLQYQLHESLAIAHERLGDLHSALDHHRYFARIKEDLAGEEKQKEIAALQVRYDIEKAEREKELYQVRAQRLESEMRQKERELTAMALNRVHMNEQIDALRSKIGELERGAGSSDESIVQKILAELDTSSGSDEAWEMFERQLDNIHNDFVRRLSERYPSLSVMELKISSLLKINLLSKDIAILLFMSVRTVETHRYNIGKKLDLPKGVRLANFLAGI